MNELTPKQLRRLAKAQKAQADYDARLAAQQERERQQATTQAESTDIDALSLTWTGKPAQRKRGRAC